MTPFIPGHWYKFFGSHDPRQFVFKVGSIEDNRIYCEIIWDDHELSDEPFLYWQGEPFEELTEDQIKAYKLEIL